MGFPIGCLDDGMKWARTQREPAVYMLGRVDGAVLRAPVATVSLMGTGDWHWDAEHRSGRLKGGVEFTRDDAMLAAQRVALTQVGEVWA